MTRFNFAQSAEPRHCVTWGKSIKTKILNTKTASVALFAALLIACSLAVGCNSDKPKPVSDNPLPLTQTPSPMPVPSASAPVTEAAAKPAPKKVVKKRPATVTYADKNYGVSFAYSRRYALETGNAAQDLVASSPLPMNFVQPGGVALAAVELPMTGFSNTDFSSAFFNVSVNKSLTAETCGKFSVADPNASKPAESAVQNSPAQTGSAETASTQAAPSQVGSTEAAATGASTQTAQETSDQTSAVPAAPASAPTPASTSAPAATQSQPSKLIIGKLELQGTETIAGEGSKKSDIKYFHVFQNGACYEFALNVTTVAPDSDAPVKPVDRNKVFSRLEKILDTLKITPVEAAPEVTASTPATEKSAAPETPAQ
jgi:hypothetical protein